jgi:hypothetical protein
MLPLVFSLPQLYYFFFPLRLSLAAGYLRRALHVSLLGVSGKQFASEL